MKCAICNAEVSKRKSVELSAFSLSDELREEFDVPKSGRACKEHDIIQVLIEARVRTLVEHRREFFEKHGNEIRIAFDRMQRGHPVQRLKEESR